MKFKIHFISRRKALFNVILFSTTFFLGCSTKTNNHITGTSMLSQFTTSEIYIDGIADLEWDQAEIYKIGLQMLGDLSDTASDCSTYGEVRSLWDGALLYLFIDVFDEELSATGRRPNMHDGVEIYMDFLNDKFPKNEEDDFIIRLNCEGNLSGSGPYNFRLKEYAFTKNNDSENKETGYSVELALFLGGIKIQNGTSIGIDFGINDANSAEERLKYRIFWASGNNRGLDDNSQWGNIILSGHDKKSDKALDTFMLKTNIDKAEDLARGIWESETELDQTLAEAKQVINSTSQKQIDEKNEALDKAIKALRRKGKYTAPYDLPEINHLPDPFTFINGDKVKNESDWSKRAGEIQDLAQYYEYGQMPGSPESLTATLTDQDILVNMHDNGNESSFTAKLFIPTEEQCGKPGPFPVIVSIDFWSGRANPIFLNAGYAVLSITYSTIGSDNNEHTGAFYSLFPYDVTTGNDAGTLLTWAWGASRAVDALEYISENNPEFSNLIDIEKLTVTGFSRCGKAALAAGFFDERFGVVNPGASGCGGAAVYRYISFAHPPYKKNPPYGNEYEWGVSTGCEVLGDKSRHQGHNANEMLPRFLNHNRIYETSTPGHGERLPYDHHEIIAAIAPRAVIITTADNDYANNAEGDCIGMEGAKPVFKFLGVENKLAVNLRHSADTDPVLPGHMQDDNQTKNLVEFCNMVFYDIPLSEKTNELFYSNPYLPTIDKYFGGLNKIMPWLNSVPEN